MKPCCVHKIESNPYLSQLKTRYPPFPGRRLLQLPHQHGGGRRQPLHVRHDAHHWGVISPVIFLLRRGCSASLLFFFEDRHRKENWALRKVVQSVGWWKIAQISCTFFGETQFSFRMRSVFRPHFHQKLYICESWANCSKIYGFRMSFMWHTKSFHPSVSALRGAWGKHHWPGVS